MTDLRDRLDDLVTREGFAPLDPALALGSGRRALRRRRVTTAVTTTAALVVAVLVVGVAVRWVTQPSAEFGDPAGRRPADSTVPTEQACAELVTARTGGRYVSITGFGWPLADMDPEDISKLDAESMCLPMLRSAAPEVPATAWEHSEAWIDEFPSRATYPSTFAAEHDGRSYDATCDLPGDFVPTARPDLSAPPAPSEAAAVADQCSYLGHVGLRGWEVRAAATGDGTVAVLRSGEQVATCLLPRRPADRAVQLSARTDPPTSEDSLVVHQSGRSAFVAGRAPERAVRVELAHGGRTTRADVVDGLFAVASTAAGPDAGTARLTALDADGNEVASYSTAELGGAEALVMARCFYSLETGNDGC